MRTLCGSHKLLLGDRIEVYTRNGIVHVVNVERTTNERYGVEMTPAQARDLARDLANYADEAES